MMIRKTKSNLNQSSGFTLVEVLVSVMVLGLLAIAIATFQKNIFIQNVFLQNSFFAEMEARTALKKMIAEMRTMTSAGTGAYPIALADNHDLTFYADLNNDGLKERIRYFLASSTLMRGQTAPSGLPLTYVDANEKILPAVHNVSTSTDIFSYYNKFYEGTSSPLMAPINIPDIRLVQLSLKIDADPNHSPTAMTFTSEVSIRNFKDNL
jgi:prepilin-type N-terminal cleavage/methylation domain-containing protein